MRADLLFERIMCLDAATTGRHFYVRRTYVVQTDELPFFTRYVELNKDRQKNSLHAVRP